MDKEVANFALKPDAVACPCGCEVVGRPLVKMSKDGLFHSVKCKCISHRNGRNRSSGLKAQRMAARSLGVPALGGFLPSDEELFGGQCRVEVKSGRQVQPMATAFLKAYLQSEAARALGDTRPIVVVAKAQPAAKDGIVAFRLQDIRAVAYSLASNLGLLVE